MNDKSCSTCINSFKRRGGGDCHSNMADSCLGEGEYLYCHWQPAIGISNESLEIDWMKNRPNPFKTDKPEKQETDYHRLATDLADLVVAKQAAYGDSFGACSKFLDLLYPTGVSPESYKDMLTIVRIFDKLKRIATDKDALGESPYGDIMGYALLALKEERDYDTKD